MLNLNQIDSTQLHTIHITHPRICYIALLVFPPEKPIYHLHARSYLLSPELFNSPSMLCASSATRLLSHTVLRWSTKRMIDQSR